MGISPPGVVPPADLASGFATSKAGLSSSTQPARPIAALPVSAAPASRRMSLRECACVRCPIACVRGYPVPVPVVVAVSVVVLCVVVVVFRCRYLRCEVDHASDEHNSEIDDFHTELVEARIVWRYFPHEKAPSNDEDNRSEDVPITKEENTGEDGENADHLPQGCTASAEKNGEYHAVSIALLAVFAIELPDQFVDFLFECDSSRDVVFELAPFLAVDFSLIVDQICVVVVAHAIGASLSMPESLW